MRTQLSGGVLTPGPAGVAVIAALRAVVDGPGTDRFLSPELEAADRLVASGEVRAAAESAVGLLA
jgi:histidine ammonia-lyase